MAREAYLVSFSWVEEVLPLSKNSPRPLSTTDPGSVEIEESKTEAVVTPKRLS